MRRGLLRSILPFACPAVLLGCSASSDVLFQSGTGSSGASGGDGGAGGAGGASSSDAGAGGFDPQTSSSGSGGDPQIAEVYGHSSSTLYKLDPTTKQVSIVGPFIGCNSIIDIALDATSAMYATSFSGLYRVDKAQAACTLIAQGDYPNSLSFVPEGTLLPDQEALVGFKGSTYVRIDTFTGKVTTVGNLGNGYASSGDVVSVKGGGTYLTVTGNGCGDCIVQVDPKTGAITKNFGSVQFGGVYGLAYWAGRAYGFSNFGDLFEIQFNAANVTTVPIQVPNAPPGLSFWGAGSTTVAPVDVPK